LPRWAGQASPRDLTGFAWPKSPGIERETMMTVPFRMGTDHFPALVVLGISHGSPEPIVFRITAIPLAALQLALREGRPEPW
jgi:hypothetical protein